LTFEHAARRYLDGGFAPPPVVVMEGFTFLTGLQSHLVECCVGRAEVHFLVAYRAEQERAFAMIHRTYTPWWGTGPAAIGHERPRSQTALSTLQDQLFDTPPAAKVDADASLSVTGFAHRHHEVAACIERIRALCDGGRDPREIVVVTRSPDQYRPLLREEAGVQGLQVRIGVPPRLLLLTPLGRFVLALYELRVDGEFAITTEQLRTVLSSGWLGARAQASAARFAGVAAQTFARCRTRPEWEHALATLAQIPADVNHLRRLPSHAIHVDDLALWESALEQVERLSARLFGTGPTSIAGHVRLLLDALESLSSENLFESERAIVVQIREALEESAQSATLAINSAEFSEILVALARQYEDTTDGASSDEARTEGGEESTGVWVTSPEGIDGVNRPIVIYLGVDDSRVPRQYLEGWPLLSDGVGAHLDLERYLFTAVVRAASEQLHVSFSHADAGGRHHASGYITAIGDVVELPRGTESARPDPVVVTAEHHATGSARRERYTLEEITQYGVCPFRYKMERLDEVAVVYREEFQVNALAQAAWVGTTLAEAERQGEILVGAESLLGYLAETLDAVENTVRAAFPGVRSLAWGTIRNWATRDLEHLVDGLDVRDFRVQIITAGEASFELADGDRVTYVDARPRFAARVGVIEKAITRDLQREAWLIWSMTDLDGPPFATFEGLQLFDSRYRAIRWWADTVWYAYAYAHPYGTRPDWVEREYETRRGEVGQLVGQLERGSFPRRPDDHCRYCPVQRECLGLDP
jgi:hypothetical protein